VRFALSALRFVRYTNFNSRVKLDGRYVEGVSNYAASSSAGRRARQKHPLTPSNVIAPTSARQGDKPVLGDGPFHRPVLSEAAREDAVALGDAARAATDTEWTEKTHGVVGEPDPLWRWVIARSARPR
jgi:hypothetical protein